MLSVQREPIAIVGIGCRFPQANNPQEFWRLLHDGKDAIRPVPSDRWQNESLYHADTTHAGTMTSRFGGFLDQVDHFDWRAFRMLPREVLQLDPQQRLLLEVAWEALEDAGLPLNQVAGSRTSVSVSTGWNDYLRLLGRDWSQLDGYTAMGNASGFAASRISYIFDLKGPSVTLNAACASSLVAISAACQSLWMGEAQLALAGGVSLMLSPESTIMVSQTGLLSPSGRCRTLDARADGFVRGEGAGVVVLKPLSLLESSDRVYALVQSVAVNHNGHNEWMIATSQAAQEDLLRDAYQKAGISPAEVDYVELHGTGLQRGDPVEVRALGSVLGLDTRRDHSCMVGSVKTNIGHLEEASGIASFIKVALSLYHREIPATLNLQTLHPELPLQDLCLDVPLETLPWPKKAGVEVAGVTALALNGSNAHAVLSASSPAQVKRQSIVQSLERYAVLPLSARSADALDASIVQMRDFLAEQIQERTDNALWQDICYTASVRRTHHAYRMAIVGRNAREALAALDAWRTGAPQVRDAATKQKHKLLLLFSHSTAVNSTQDWVVLLKEPAFREVVQKCDQFLTGSSASSLIEELQMRKVVHLPKMVLCFVFQIALAALWRSWGIVPDSIVAEGTGEIAAAYIAGAMSLPDALRLLYMLDEEPKRALELAQIDTEHMQTCGVDVPVYSTSVGCVGTTTSFQVQHWRTCLHHPELTVSVFDELLADGYDVFIEAGYPSGIMAAFYARLQEQQHIGTLLSTLHAKHDPSFMLACAVQTLYALGYDIRWSTLYAAHEANACVSLPTYPWQRERIWPEWLDVKEISTPPQERQGTRQTGEAHGAVSDIAIASGPLEEVLTTLWAEVLGLKHVEPDDSFFALGGHSLLALQLLARIRSVLQVDISLADLLHAASPISCAALIAPADSFVDRERGVTQSLQIKPDHASRYQPFPLTDIQQAYWVGRNAAFEMGSVGNHAYAEVEACDLDLERFSRAIQRLIDRHEMLRAVLLPDGQQQVLEHVPPFELLCEDLRTLDEDAREQRLLQIRRSLDHQVIELERWPAFEIHVSLLDDHHMRLHVSIEALFIDAWSFNTLIQELVRFYYEPDLELPPIEFSFRDYVLAEAELHDTEPYRRSEQYWLERLASLPPAPDLPLASTSSAARVQSRFVHREARLDGVRWQRLKAHAAQAGLTPSGVLLTAFAEVIAMWSKTPRFCINLSTFNRLPLHPDVKSIVGDFTSIALLAVDFSSHHTFEERACAVQEQLWRDLDHGRYSGIRVLRNLARIQNDAGKAVMPIVFTSLLVQDTALSQTKPWQDTVYCVSQTPQVWLDHQVLESNGELVFHWQAVDEIFPAGLIDAMFDAYCHSLDTLALTEESWHDSQRYIVPAAQLLPCTLANETDAPVSQKLLHEFFLKQVGQRPLQPAIVTNTRTLTYQEVYDRAVQLACHLRQLGVQPNQLVGVVMEKEWEQVVAVLAILIAGGAYLPIDASYPHERLLYLLEHGSVRVALTQSRISHGLSLPADVTLIPVDTFEASDKPVSVPAMVQQPTDLTYVIYTSGSTGLPKGVMIDHRGAVNTILDINQRFHVGPEDRVLALSALNFDLSVYDIFGILGAGGTIVLPTSYAVRDPAYWLELLIRERVTIWNSVPALLQLFVEYVEQTAIPMVQVCLRQAMLSGDWIPLTLPARIKRLVPSIEVTSLGGATEASIWSILYPIDRVEPGWKSIPYGRPMQNQRFYVLNEMLEPCPVWVPGQLYIGGIGLAHGYWRDEERTQASFFVHPHTGERLYRTGDLGRYLPDGIIEFLGREDFQVKVQGYRIELGEIETVLMQFPLVREAVVNAVGERLGDKRLIAYIVPKADREINKDELRAFLQEHLPSYMVPTSFVWLPEIPLSANGKVDRKALALPVLTSSESGSIPMVSDVPNALLAQITQCVVEILHVQAIDPVVSLLEYGATSLSIVRVVNQVEKVLSFRPKLEEFFRTPTVLWLATSYYQHVAQRKPEMVLARVSASEEREEGEL